MSIVNSTLFLASSYLLTRRFVPSADARVTAVVGIVLDTLQSVVHQTLRERYAPPQNQEMQAWDRSLSQKRFDLISSPIPALFTATHFYISKFFPQAMGSPMTVLSITSASSILALAGQSLYNITFSKDSAGWKALYRILRPAHRPDAGNMKAATFPFPSLRERISYNTLSAISFYGLAHAVWKLHHPFQSTLVTLIPAQCHALIQTFIWSQMKKFYALSTNQEERNTVVFFSNFIHSCCWLLNLFATHQLAQRYLPSTPFVSIRGISVITNSIALPLIAAFPLLVHAISPSIYARFWVPPIPKAESH